MKNRGLPEQIAETIVSDVILPRSLAPGDQLPTVRELQRKFEVSTSTISAALDILEDQGTISRQHRNGSFLKSQPSHAPAPGKTCRKIGLIYPAFTTKPLLKDILRGMERICKAQRIELSVATVETYGQEQAKATEMAHADLDALVIYPHPRTIKQFRSDYLASELPGLPIILIDLAYPAQMRTNITFDNYQLGFDITLKLLEEGHRNIAFKKLKSQNKEIHYRSNNDRYQGYLDALQFKGITPLPEFCWAENFSIHLKPEEKLAIDFLRNFKEKPLAQRPTAVISLEDNHAAALIHCAKELGIRIPEDLKIVGFDSNPDAHRLADIPFPTSCPDFEKMGSLAANLAIREVRSPSSPLNYVLPVELNWV